MLKFHWNVWNKLINFFDYTCAQGEINDYFAWRLVTYHNLENSKSGLLTEFWISATSAHSKYTIIFDAYDFQNAVWAWHM